MLSGHDLAENTHYGTLSIYVISLEFDMWLEEAGPFQLTPARLGTHGDAVS